MNFIFKDQNSYELHVDDSKGQFINKFTENKEKNSFEQEFVVANLSDSEAIPYKCRITVYKELSLWQRICNTFSKNYVLQNVTTREGRPCYFFIFKKHLHNVQKNPLTSEDILMTGWPEMGRNVYTEVTREEVTREDLNIREDLESKEEVSKIENLPDHPSLSSLEKYILNVMIKKLSCSFGDITFANDVKLHLNQVTNRLAGTLEKDVIEKIKNRVSDVLRDINEKKISYEFLTSVMESIVEKSEKSIERVIKLITDSARKELPLDTVLASDDFKGECTNFFSLLPIALLIEFNAVCENFVNSLDKEKKGEGLALAIATMQSAMIDRIEAENGS